MNVTNPKHNQYKPTGQNMWEGFMNKDTFDRKFNRGKHFTTVNVQNKNNAYNLEIEAPNFEENDFEVNVDNGILVVSCEKREEHIDDHQEMKVRECSYVSSERRFTLPENVDTQHMEVKYENNTLKIDIPNGYTS